MIWQAYCLSLHGEKNQYTIFNSSGIQQYGVLLYSEYHIKMETQQKQQIITISLSLSPLSHISLSSISLTWRRPDAAGGEQRPVSDVLPAADRLLRARKGLKTNDNAKKR